MNFVCIVSELGDKMLTLSSMENLIAQCNQDILSQIIDVIQSDVHKCIRIDGSRKHLYRCNPKNG